MSVPCMPPGCADNVYYHQNEDGETALQAARDLFTRRQEGVSLWVVPSADIVASDPSAEAELFEPAADKAYRFPTSYVLPADVGHM